MAGYTVYMHITPCGKVYVGITGRDVKKRWNNGNGYRGNKHFWSAINKYGWEHIRHEIIASGLSKRDAAELEKELISKHKANDPRLGYNHSEGGEHPTTGARHTEEHKERMSKLLTGRVFSDETRAKMSASAKRRAPETRHRVQTEETKRKISEANKGNKVSDYCRQMSTLKNSYAGNPSARKVDQLAIDGTYIASYSCIKEAAEKNGCSRTHISSVCTGQRKTCGGYVWRYTEAI